MLTKHLLGTHIYPQQKYGCSWYRQTCSSLPPPRPVISLLTVSRRCVFCGSFFVICDSCLSAKLSCLFLAAFPFFLSFIIHFGNFSKLSQHRKFTIRHVSSLNSSKEHLFGCSRDIPGIQANHDFFFRRPNCS